jgi:hypothetical protein
MGEDISIEDDHHRKLDRLCNAISLEDGVEDLLIMFAIELNPPRIPLRKGVTLVTPDIPWWGNGSIDIHQHNREAGPGGPMEHFMHIG